jgi:hypothetical protein
MKHALGLALSVGAAALPLAVGCGDEPLRPLFEPKPECQGASIVPYQGNHQNLISAISISEREDSFDLDGDGQPDNALSAVGSLARQPIEEAIRDYELMIPFEFFDLPSVTDDACVKFAIYLGVYKRDRDGDGFYTSVGRRGDCDDTRATSGPGMPEIPGNLLDDDCDGLVDETDAGPTPNAVDNDGDGWTPEDGDCDDTSETGHLVSPDMPEICGDGLDNDCNGVADDGDLCNPYLHANEVALDPLSFDDAGAPVIAFTSGEIRGGKLTAGPSIFAVNIPVIDGLSLELKITGAQIEADIEMVGDSVRLRNGRLGGVIDARTADNIRGLDVPEISLTPENSLLDATFANVLGALLGLRTVPGHPGCRVPDIDVDRDGLEMFCDSDLTDDVKAVDMCIDGDGTVVMDTLDAEGNVIEHCTEAKLPDGRYRFVDGISVGLQFETVPTILVAE